MLTWALVFVGGGVGSLLRHVISMAVQNWHGGGDPSRFPLGTLFVNVVGCVLIGFAAGWCAQREPARAVVVVGMLGGFTTFSSFGLDTIRLLSEGHPYKAVLYVSLTIAAGLLAVWLTYETGYALDPVVLDAD